MQKSKRINYYFAALFTWTTLLVSLIIFDLYKINDESDVLAKTEARANFNKDLAIRFWLASHGGAYVPINSKTQPNPALSHLSDRDILTSTGNKLTLINPAFMIRQLNEYFAEYYGVVGHLTSKKVLRPENKPDEWELSALNQFEEGATEISEYSEIDGKPFLRLMQPLITEESCIKCHASQGYKVGDIRGGIGIAIPMKSILERSMRQKRRNISAYILIWIIGLLVFSYSYRKLNISIQKQEETEHDLKIQNKEYAVLNKELLISNEKALESDKLKSAFLLNMSHEIRTPMNGILGFSDLLADQDLGMEEKQEYLDIIKHSGNRMLDTVNDIIEISKIETGQIQISNSTVDIKQELTKMYDFFLPQADEKGLKLSLNYEVEQEKSEIETDSSKLDSILTTLIKNAIKFTNEGYVVISCKVEDNNFKFSVKDTGIGIPMNRQKAIFNMFEQADISTTRTFEGSGLGLAIAKSYVKMLGGEISVESEEGKGSVFNFSIPN